MRSISNILNFKTLSEKFIAIFCANSPIYPSNQSQSSSIPSIQCSPPRMSPPSPQQTFQTRSTKKEGTTEDGDASCGIAQLVRELVRRGRARFRGLLDFFPQRIYDRRRTWVSYRIWIFITLLTEGLAFSPIWSTREAIPSCRWKALWSKFWAIFLQVSK